MNQVQVTNTVRKARITAGLTQAELAAHCRVTRQTIGLIEAGSYNPTIRLALLIGRAVNRDISELFELADATGSGSRKP